MTIHERPFGRYVEDFVPGDIYRHWPGKTITEADDHLFCMITMNHHPLHTNQWFAENETVHGKNVVLHEFGYDGHVGLEFHPTGTTSTAVQHLRDTFQVLFTHMPEIGSE
jgi:acyl dehydratase